MNEQNSKSTEKREWVEPTLTHINAAETMGGLLVNHTEKYVDIIHGVGTFNGGSFSH
jgi:hypothetical protein